MADWQIPIIILAGASLVAGFILLKKHKDRDQKVEVLYGYPANSTTWLTIYHYRRKRRTCGETATKYHRHNLRKLQIPSNETLQK
ncbi:hypothetical protein [Escherichia coli]|uniref:hypothetical protein n=1 Tax=Escherichia coli TaxID=562 RepID=UPI000BE794B1